MEKEIIQAIKIPDGIKVELKDDHTLSVSNDKGTLTRTFKSHRLKLNVSSQTVTLEGSPVNKQTRALLMAVVAHIKNMAKGLLFGYQYNMKIVYSHFPMTAKVEGAELVITNFIGEKNTRKAKIIGDTKVEIKGEDVTVTGLDIEPVSQTATNIEQIAKVKGKDIRRYTDGIYLIDKSTIEEKPLDFMIEVTRGQVAELDGTKIPTPTKEHKKDKSVKKEEKDDEGLGEKVKDEIVEVAEKVEEKVEDVIEAVEEKVEDAVEKVEDVIEDIKEKITHKKEDKEEKKDEKKE